MKKLISVCLALLLAFSCLGAVLPSASAQGGNMPVSGQCGENLTWTFTPSTGELIIEGTGFMKDFYADDTEYPVTPWSAYRTQIKKVVIGDGVSSIGHLAFGEAYFLETVILSDSVTSVDASFCDCYKLSHVTLGRSLNRIDYAFDGCYALVEICNNSSLDIANEYLGDIHGRVLNIYSDKTGCTKLTKDGDFTIYSDGLEKSVVCYTGTDTSVTLPDGCTEIRGCAFTYVDSVRRVDLPQSMRKISKNAFYNSGVTKIDLNAGLSEIENGAFYDCWFLIEICNNSGLLLKKGSTENGNIARYALHIYTGDPENTVLYQNGDFYMADIQNERYLIKYSGTETNVTLPEGCTDVYRQAFRRNPQIETVVMPDTVKTIGEEAFYACPNLQTVTFSANLEKIGAWAFWKCEKLVSAPFPQKLADIGEWAFCEDVLLKEACFPETIESIGAMAFEGCHGFKKVTLPDKVIRIGSGAFSYAFGLQYADGIYYAGKHAVSADNITAAKIREGTITIAEGTFTARLRSVYIPKSVQFINNGAFVGCSLLSAITVSDENPYYTVSDKCLFSKDITELLRFPCNGSRLNYTIPDTVKKIDMDAFAAAQEMNALYIPRTVTEVDCGAFGTGFNPKVYCYVDCPAYAVLKNSYAKNLVPMQDVITGTCGDHIQWELVLSTGKLTLTGSGEMPWFSITDIFSNYNSTSTAPWFIYAKYIKSIVVENGITSIGARAFSGCAAAETAELGDSVEKIGSYAFSNCHMLTTVSSPANLTNIETAAFIGCDSLPAFSIPAGVVSIGGSAFAECKNLKSIVVPEGVSTIAGETFRSCESLESCVLPDGITSIGSHAFYHCYKLADLNITPNLTKVGNYAFYYCTSLKRMPLTDHVEKLGTAAFYFCSSLEETHLPADLKEIPMGLFCGCESLENLELPQGLTAIHERAFEGCKKLRGITVPESVTVLESAAFKGCESLTEAFIPTSGYELSNSVYQGCKSLKSVTIPDSIMYLGSFAFAGCTSLETIHFSPKMEYIDSSCFQGCTALQEVALPDTIRYVFSYAFSDCVRLNSIHLPKEACELGAYVFNNTAYANDEANWEDGVLYIDDYLVQARGSFEHYSVKEGTVSIADAFSNQQSMTSIDFPESLVVISGYAFHHTSIKTVELPKNVAEVGSDAFYCSPVETLVIRAKDIEIDRSAFQDTVSLTVRIGADCKLRGEKCFYRSKIDIVVYEEGTETVETSLFSEVGSVDKVVLPDSVQSVEGTGILEAKSVTIYCNEASYAQNYAKANNIRYTTLQISPLSDETFCNRSILPECTVKTGNRLLAKTLDYTVAGENNFNVGTATLTVRGTGDFKALSAKAQFRIVAKQMNASASVQEDLVYSGKSIVPGIQVYESDLNTPLTEGKDYRVDYGANTVSAGKKNVNVIGMGNYSGSLTADYTVKQQEISAVSVNILPGDTFRVVGGGDVLEKNVDYAVLSSKNQGAKYTVVLRGLKNYTGEHTFQVEESASDYAMSQVISLLVKLIGMLIHRFG